MTECIYYILGVSYDPIYLLGDYATIQHEEKLIRWQYIEPLNTLQEEEGVVLRNKLSETRIECYVHNMNDRVAARTISSSVADATDFLREYTAKEEVRKPNISFETLIAFRSAKHEKYTWKRIKTPLCLENMKEWEQFLEEIYEYILNLKDDTGRPRRAERGKTAVIDYAAARKSPLNISIDHITQTQRREEKHPYCNAVQVGPPQNTDEEQHFAVQHWKLHILHICNFFKTLLDVNSLIIYFCHY